MGIVIFALRLLEITLTAPLTEQGQNFKKQIYMFSNYFLTENINMNLILYFLKPVLHVIPKFMNILGLEILLVKFRFKEFHLSVQSFPESSFN